MFCEFREELRERGEKKNHTYAGEAGHLVEAHEHREATRNPAGTERPRRGEAELAGVKP